MEVKELKINRPYEAVILVHPDATEEDQKKLFKNNKKIIEDAGGKWNHIDTWGKRKLANEINKQRRATYFHCTFETFPTTIAELERTMKINEKVLRVYHARMDQRKNAQQHLEDYRAVIQESVNREREREARVEKARRSRQRM